VILDGSPDYYSRFGFRPGQALWLRRPSTRIPPAAFQALALPPHEPWMIGTVVYAEPFWALDRVGLRDVGAASSSVARSSSSRRG
jgi:putative acetyltransferase